MNKTQIVKHVLAIVFFALLTLVYFKPLLDGKDVQQSDMLHFEGMSKELTDYHENTGGYSYWTNAMFSGMTSTYIYGPPDANVYNWLSAPIQKGTPMRSFGIIFMMLIGAYIAMLAFGMSFWVALGAAIAYAFCSYNFIIIEAGHITKAYAIAVLPLVISGVVLAYQNKRVAGFFLFMIGFGLSLAQSHPQITYYTALAVAAYALIVFIYAIIQKTLLDFFKSSGVLIIALILALLPNLGLLYQSYDYSKESMRGKSELTAKAEENGSGLAYDYAYAWSYGKGETFSLLVPNMAGGASHFRTFEEMQEFMPSTINTLQTKRFEQDPNQLLQQCSTYWGEQPFTSGPVYVGAVICLLFVFSLFVVKGKMRIWAIVVFLFSIALAWGKHFPLLNDFFFNYFPMHNKFRTPSMILVLTAFIMAFYGFYGLNILTDKNKQTDKKKINRHLYISFGIVGGMSLLFAIMPNVFFDFTCDRDNLLPAELLAALQSDRQAMLVADAWRTLGFVFVTAILLWLIINEKVKKQQYIVVVISLLALFDLWNVDKRYLNDNNFEEKKVSINQQYQFTPCDAAIKQDVSLGYRVLNLAASPFNDAHASYFHHSIGGYHGAKIRRYQEFIDSVMMNDLNRFTTQINTIRSDSEQHVFMSSLQSLNMLNAKYFIYNYQAAPLVNTEIFGPAWFVDNVKMVDNADEEIAAFRNTDVKTTAIVNKQFAQQVQKFNSQHNKNSTIALIQKDSKTLTYNVNAVKDELVVFSEIFYPKYWKVTIDGKDCSADLFRADYILRAMMVPQGQHTIHFEFVPQAWINARTVSMISSILILLFMLGSLAYYAYNYYKKNPKTFAKAEQR